MTGWIFRLLTLSLCQILSYVFVIANLMYTMVITNFNLIQCCVQKVHDSAQFSDITFQWKIYSQGTVLLHCDLYSHSFLFSSYFFFCPPSSFRRYFPVFLTEVEFTSRFGRKADSYSEIQFGAIFHLLVYNRTPHRSKPVVIREPTTIYDQNIFKSLIDESTCRGTVVDPPSISPQLISICHPAARKQCCSGGIARCSAMLWSEVTSSTELHWSSPAQMRQCIHVSLAVER